MTERVADDGAVAAGRTIEGGVIAGGRTIDDGVLEGLTSGGERYECSTVHVSGDATVAVLTVVVWIYGPEDRQARAIAQTYRRPGPFPPVEPQRYHARFPDGGGEVFVACAVPLPAPPDALQQAAERLGAVALDARRAFTGRRRHLRPARPAGGPQT